MSKETILLTHKGTFDSAVVNSLLSELKKIINQEIENVVTRKRIYGISVECLENIVRHGADKPVKYNLFQLIKASNSYFITAGNILNITDRPHLENILSDIENLDVTQLKAKHSATLDAGELAAKGGAGIGMYDIAIKSEKNITYRFKTINEDVCLFQLEVKL